MGTMKKNEELEGLEPISEEFANAVGRMHQSIAVCDLCGRTHFATDPEVLDLEEINEFKELKKQQPDRYVAWDEWISMGVIDSKSVIPNCPCNRLRLYEDFHIHHREMFEDYYEATKED